MILEPIQSLLGHVYTVGPTVAGWIPRKDPATDWIGHVEDPEVGEITLRGKVHFHSNPLSDPTVSTLLILIHGLGGSSDSTYMRDAARDGFQMGYDVLRLSLRGADASGQDLYNAGLTADLHAAIASPQFSAYQNIVVMGFSLGGHIALWAAVEGLDKRVKSVVAIGSPVDLSPGVNVLDGKSRKIYREYILRELRDLYAAYASQTGRAETPLERVQKVRYIREFDELTIVPRFGFDDVEDYYQKSSVGPLLPDLTIPCLYVGSTYDPMIPRRLVEPWVSKAGPNLKVIWVDDGGHVYFPMVDLGFGERRGVVAQSLSYVQSM